MKTFRLILIVSFVLISVTGCPSQNDGGTTLAPPQPGNIPVDAADQEPAVHTQATGYQLVVPKQDPQIISYTGITN